LEKELFTSLMRKASLSCFAVGIFAISSSIAQSVLSFLALDPITSALSAAMISGHIDPSLLTQLGQVMNAFLLPTLALLTVTLLLTIVFAFYSYKVGQAYEIGSGKIAGPSYVIMQLAAIPVLLASYQILGMLPQIISDPMSVVSQLLGIILIIGVGALLALAFMLVFIITFAIALHRMRIQTDISLFDTAMWLIIIAIILTFLNSVFTSMGIPISIGDLFLQIGIITYGLALSRAGRMGAVPKLLKDRSATGES